MLLNSNTTAYGTILASASAVTELVAQSPTALITSIIGLLTIVGQIILKFRKPKKDD